MSKPSVHYSPGGAHVIPETLCRIGTEHPQRTSVMADVTCKRCLKVIRDLGLKPRHAFPAMPTFEAKRTPSGGLAFRCPVCGWRNLHGGTAGHRVSHCGCWGEGYVITAPGDDPQRGSAT
jgi:hypothetical protein